MNRIYLDNNASTALDPKVLEAMMPYLTAHHGNALSVHSYGRDVRKAVEDARDHVAALIGSSSREILFTSGGTEANNLAIRGVVKAHEGGRRKIITSLVEHSSVSGPLADLAASGYEVVPLPVDGSGRIDAESLKAALDESTLMVAIMLANNETGAIQPVKQLAGLAHEAGALVHTDAVQAAAKIPFTVDDLGADLLTLGGHKFYGPHGIGALYVRKGTSIEGVTFGASHEGGLRPGTHNTPGIVGIGEAARLAAERGEEDRRHMAKVTGHLEERLLREIPASKVNGPPLRDRLPNTLNLCIAEAEAESLLLGLDVAGIAVSAGSACHSGGIEPSGVLLAMGISRSDALSSLRISLSRCTTADEADRFAETLGRLASNLRADHESPGS